MNIWTHHSFVSSQIRVCQTDRQTDRRTEFSLLDHVCIPCSSVIKNSCWLVYISCILTLSIKMMMTMWWKIGVIDIQAELNLVLISSWVNGVDRHPQSNHARSQRLHGRTIRYIHQFQRLSKVFAAVDNQHAALPCEFKQSRHMTVSVRRRTERAKTRRPSVTAAAVERLADRERGRDWYSVTTNSQVWGGISWSACMMWGLHLFSLEFAVWDCACDWWSSVINVYKPVTYHNRLHVTKHLNVGLRGAFKKFVV